MTPIIFEIFFAGTYFGKRRWILSTDTLPFPRLLTRRCSLGRWWVSGPFSPTTPCLGLPTPRPSSLIPSSNSLWSTQGTHSWLAAIYQKWTGEFLAFSHCICVSHTGKENTVLRSGVPKSDIFVIPNAVDATMFEPDYDRERPPGKVVVVLGSRLVYRKGKEELHSFQSIY